MLALLAAAVLTQLVLASVIAGERRASAVMLAGVVAFALVAWIEPRLSFAIPCFYLVLAIPESASVSASDLVMILPVVVVGVSWLTGGEIARRAGHMLRSHPYKVAVILFCALVVVGVGKAIVGGESEGALQPLRLAIAPAMLLSLAVFRDRHDLLRWLRGIFYLHAVYQLFYFFGVLAGAVSATTASEVSTGGERLVSNSTAMYLAIGFILMVHHMASEDRLVRRLGLTALMGITLLLIVLALARTTWASFAIATLLLVLLTRDTRRGLYRFGALAAPFLVLAALLVPVFAADQVDTIRERTSRPEGPGQKDQSAAFRENAWGLMLDRWEESPVLGRGFGQTVTFISNAGYTIVVTNDPHSGFIFLLVSLGIVGLAVFLLIQVGFLRASVRATRAGPSARPLALWAINAWIIVMGNMALGVLLGSKPHLTFMWLLLAIPVAILALPERADPPADADAGEAAPARGRRTARPPRDPLLSS